MSKPVACPGRRPFDKLSHAPTLKVKCVTLASGAVSLSYEMNLGRATGPNKQTRRPLMSTTEDTAMRTTPDPPTRELDHRYGDGIEVKLLWNSLTDRVSVTVEDERTGEFFELGVDPADALIAFEHPYAYASRGWWSDRALAA
jgi:hypothetical protein